MPPGISKKSWLGVAREATPGTAMTAPTLYDPTKSTMKAMKKREFLDEERGDRNGQYDAVDVQRFTDWDKKGPLYPDLAPYYLGGALGSIASAQPAPGTDPNVYKHTISLSDVPFSLTLFKSYAAQFYYSPYSVVEKFSIKFDSSKLMEFNCSGKAIWPTIWTPSGSVAFSQVPPFPGYAPTIKLFNASTTDIDELEITFEQKITLWVPASGTIDWITAYYGERKVGLSFTARFDSDTLYQRFKTSAYDMFSLDVLGPVISHAYNYELNCVIPVIEYDSMEHDLGKDNVLIKAKASALSTKQTINGQSQDGTGNNLIQMYVQNTTTGYAS